jgi:hypothetical protein
MKKLLQKGKINDGLHGVKVNISLKPVNRAISNEMMQILPSPPLPFSFFFAFGKIHISRPPPSLMKTDPHGRVLLPFLRKLDFFKMPQVLEPDFTTEQAKRYTSSTCFSRLMSIIFPIVLAAYLYFSIQDNNNRTDVETIKFVQTSTSKDASEWQKSFEVQCKAPICLFLHAYSTRMIEEAGIQCIEMFGGTEHLILTEGQTTTMTPCYVRGGMNEGIIFAAAYPPSKFASLAEGEKVKLPGM